MNKPYILLGILALVAFVLSFAAGYHVAISRQVESVSDTVTKVVPMWKESPQPAKTSLAGYISVPWYKFLPDTVERAGITPSALDSIGQPADSIPEVYLPREQKYYAEADGRLRIWVSGFDPNLDRWEFDDLQTTITETIHPPPKRWNLDLFAGAGGTLTGSQSIPAAQAGLEIGYRPGRWGFDLLGGYSVTMVNGEPVTAPFIGGRAKLNIISW